MTDATVNIEIYAGDKITLKELVKQVVEKMDRKLPITGFDVVEWRIGSTNFRSMGDGVVQASLEFDYLIQPAE